MSIDFEENKSLIKSRYRPEIDGLRAFAVVAVIINHFNKVILPSGYLGVDIFFVISGFVITSSLYQRPNKNFKDFISEFYEKRIKRLVPALSILILISSIAICLFNPTAGTSLLTGLTSLFGLSNLYLLKQSTNYFAQATELNVFSHTWSLAVEEQFYILFPFLIWFSGFGRQTKNGSRNLSLTIGVLSIASLISFLYLYPINQSAAYYLLPTRFWEIASGCLLFIGFQKKKSIKKYLEKVPPILVLAVIIGIMCLPISLGGESTVAVVGLTAVLITSLKKQTTTYVILTHPKVVYIGLISYSLYLWHWAVLSISRWTIGIHWWSVPLQVALMIGLAITSYRFIEKPLRKNNWFEKRWKTIIVAGGIIVTLSGVLITLGKPLKGLLYTGKKLETKKPIYQKGEKCLTNSSKSTLCYLIDNKSQKNLWMLGDSHASSLTLAGEKVANSLGMNMKLYRVEATPFPPINNNQKKEKKLDLLRLNDQKLVEKELYSQIKVGDVILLTIRMPYQFINTNYENLTSDFPNIIKNGSFDFHKNYFIDWIASVTNLANMAQKQGAKVIIQTPIPEWEKEYLNKRCSTSNIQWFNSLNKKKCQIKSQFFIDEEKGLYKHLFKKLNILSSSHENIYLFDTYKVACPDSICSFTMNGIDIYRDSHHFSYEWARDFLSLEIYKFINIIQIIGN